MNTNVFEGYGNNILIAPNRTCTEIAFEQWCEDDKHPVKHVIRMVIRVMNILESFIEKHLEEIISIQIISFKLKMVMFGLLRRRGE